MVWTYKIRINTRDMSGGNCSWFQIGWPLVQALYCTLFFRWLWLQIVDGYYTRLLPVSSVGTSMKKTLEWFSFFGYHGRRNLVGRRQVETSTRDDKLIVILINVLRNSYVETTILYQANSAPLLRDKFIIAIFDSKKRLNHHSKDSAEVALWPIWINWLVNTPS